MDAVALLLILAAIYAVPLSILYWAERLEREGRHRAAQGLLLLLGGLFVALVIWVGHTP